MKIENAIVQSVFLGIEDHGMLTAWVHVKRAFGCQGFGGFRLDTYVKASNKSVEHPACGLFVSRVLKVVGREEWSKLVGAPCRIRIGDSDSIEAIGNLIEEVWFSPKEEFAKFYRVAR